EMMMAKISIFFMRGMKNCLSFFCVFCGRLIILIAKLQNQIMTTMAKGWKSAFKERDKLRRW
ncbi:MAG: hypothetical protein IKD25_04520, partial [Bacteroidaceae bacterium]|nr:hypothetical protein [Bacteroidaceae bacterium]